MSAREERPEPLLRTMLGAALRRERLNQRRTLRDVSAAARVSLGYLSEIERGQKEASSELLAAICSSLQIRVLDVLRGLFEERVVLTDSTAALEAVGTPVQLRPATAASPAALVDRAA